MYVNEGSFMQDTRRLTKQTLDTYGKLRVRLEPDPNDNETWYGIIENPSRTNDDDLGALYYVVAVIFIYGLSIVMMIASHIRKNKQDSQLRTYLKEMSNLRKTERREKVLNKMTDLARRERERAEREAESRRKLQEKLRPLTTQSPADSGDDTESEATTVPRDRSTKMDKQQRRPLLQASSKSALCSASPTVSTTSLVTGPTKDEKSGEEEGTDGREEDNVSEKDSVFMSPQTSRSNIPLAHKHPDGIPGGRGMGLRSDMRISSSSSCYSPLLSPSPLVRSGPGSSTAFYYTVPSDRQSPLLSRGDKDRSAFSSRLRSPSLHDYRRWRRPTFGQDFKFKVGRGALKSPSRGEQRSPGSSRSPSFNDIRFSPQCGSKSPTLAETRSLDSKKTNNPKIFAAFTDFNKSLRSNDGKQSTSNKKPSTVVMNSKSSFPASFYVVDEDAVL